MDELSDSDDAVDNPLKRARDSFDRDFKSQISKLAKRRRGLKGRRNDLDAKINDPARANLDAKEGDLIEVNAGGTIVAAKRSTLTQLKGTRFEALFSGRWEKKLQRDGRGRIFMDVNPVGFRAIVDYLNEMAISSEDNRPSPPHVADEDSHVLQHQLELFGLVDIMSALEMPDSNIVKNLDDVTKLHEWLKDDGSDGKLSLLYRSSGDGLDHFHSKCDNQGCTLLIIETICGFVLGGYSNTPWTKGSAGLNHKANKAFLFVLSGNGMSPCKMKLKNENDHMAVRHHSTSGPIFGQWINPSNDLWMNGTQVGLNIGNTYEPFPPQPDNSSLPNGWLQIKEMEVFRISGTSYCATVASAQPQSPQIVPAQPQTPQIVPVTRFSEDINDLVNAKQESLQQAEAEMLRLEDGFKDQLDFVTSFASGHAKDVVTLNVSGAMMATQRSTLQAVEDSVLAQQFDDSKWTEQGCNGTHVKDWKPEDVCLWAQSIDDISNEVANIFLNNKITGNELLAFNMEGLKMIGIERAGTLCLLLKEIEKLENAASNDVTLIEHSPYCFGKILDYLRMRQLHSRGLAEEPALPKVCDMQKSRFEKVVKYYFPGESSKFILG